MPSACLPSPATTNQSTHPLANFPNPAPQQFKRHGSTTGRVKNLLASGSRPGVECCHLIHSINFMSYIIINPVPIIRVFALVFFLPCVLCAAEPTEVRSWKSTAGSSIEARAKSLDGGVVALELWVGASLRTRSENSRRKTAPCWRNISAGPAERTPRGSASPPRWRIPWQGGGADRGTGFSLFPLFAEIAQSRPQGSAALLH